MNIALPSEWEQFVIQQANNGEYLCESEVILHGLQLLRDFKQLDDRRLEELRDEIRIGIEQAERGEVAPFDAKAILNDVRNRRTVNGKKIDGAASPNYASET